MTLRNALLDAIEGIKSDNPAVYTQAWNEINLYISTTDVSMLLRTDLFEALKKKAGSFGLVFDGQNQVYRRANNSLFN